MASREVLALDSPGPIHAVCLRLDGSLVDGKPVFFELNADIPQGIGLSDAFAAFLAEQPSRQIGKHVTGLSPPPDLLHSAG